MTFKYRYRKQIIIGIILFFIIGGIISFSIYHYLTEEKEEEEPIVLEKKEEKKTKNEETKQVEYKVDIKGEINMPGIYSMKENSRVIDQTTPNMIQRISGIFERKPLISKEI